MVLRSLLPTERLAFMAFGLLSAALIIFLYWTRPGFLVSMDLKAFDAVTATRGVTPAPEEVVIVAVDEKSVNELGRWPWPRKRIAELVRKLSSARITAVDVVFSEPEGAEADTALSSAIEEAGNVVLGYFFRNDSTVAPEKMSLAHLKRSGINLVRYSGPEDPPGGGPPAVPELPVRSFTGVEPNIPVVGEWAAGFGSFNIIAEEDGIYRAANLVYGYNGELYPALALEAVRRYLPGTILLDAAEYGIDRIYIDEAGVPVDEEGALLLNFYGPAGTFRTYPASDVLYDRIPEEAFRDRLVFVGVTEKGIYDIRPAPVDALFPGVEIQATIAGNILESWYLVRDTRVVIFDLLMILLLPLVLSVVLAGFRNTLVSLVVFIALSAVSVLVGYTLFASFSIRPVFVYPVASLLCSYLSCEAYRNLVVERRSRYLKKAFSTYVSTQLVSEILRDPGSLKLGGEKRELTVLFSDIRGFASISESLAPEELVQLLNKYLNPMTRIILDEEGTLDKYIGDAIMAIFNAPVEVPDHPARACFAALRMISMLDELNKAWQAAGCPALSAGIGISTGEAIVGNMGTELRFDYTAIGDTVNLSSRLEGMNKVYRTRAIVSEKTRLLAGDGFVFRELDTVRVKGRKEGIVVYELIGLDGAAPAGLAEGFSRALDLYRKRSFPEALNAFEEVFKDHPGDGPSEVYIERCVRFMTDPPPRNWDGVFAAESK